MGYEIAYKDIKDKSLEGLVHKSLIDAIAEVREYGSMKYGGLENWRKVEEDHYYHALMRHVVAMCDARFNSKSKETMLDSESGLSHAAHAACNLMFILEIDKEKEFLEKIDEKKLDNSFKDKELL